jgi:hypothetical protein
VKISYTKDTLISDVISDPVFDDYGKLIFPVNSGYMSGNTLGTLGLTWYNNIVPDKTVEIVNYMKSQVESGKAIFYNIYSKSELKIDPSKKNTGLFYFRGKSGKKIAVVNAGGGFAYVGAMQDSFPHALELSKKGYNASAFAKSEDKGNLAFLEKERYTHDYPTLCEYTYNGLCFFWNKAK